MVFDGRSEAVSLALTSGGKPRVAVSRRDSWGEGVQYWTCEQNCGVVAGWTGTAVFSASRYSDARLLLDSADRPRLMFNYGTIGGETSVYDNRLNFTWCDSDCGNQASWKGYQVGAVGDGRAGFDFALHNGAVFAATSRGVDAAVLLRCPGGCTGGSSSWTVRVLETVASFTALTPPAVPVGYTNAFWEVGSWPTVVVNPVHGTLHLTWINSARGTAPNGKSEDGAELARIAELPL